MDEVAKWVIRSRLGPICDLLEDALADDCVSIKGRVGDGGWWLLVAAVCTITVHAITLYHRLNLTAAVESREVG